ncbi:guanidine nucleotide exchange factor [Plasmodium brasilianum]|uniref:Guanidine nucleotide exchange factor n=1 Tax=Plasmodium brasilianum TaxID=5824 RepID=A0ACB9YEC0_PLABR|nr:guanidine nucleotide exchange factor [Plasmodium brasilianum]
MNKENNDTNEVHKYIFSFCPKVSSGLDHYACVGNFKNKPAAYCWGGNTSNQLGIGIHTRYCNKPTVVKFFENFIVSSICCTNYTTFVLVKNNISDNGCSIYSFGKGNNGLLGYKKKKSLLKSTNIAIEEEKENKKKKKLNKINNKVNKALLSAFGVNTKRETSSSSKSSLDSLLDFDMDRISSIAGENTGWDNSWGESREKKIGGRGSDCSTNALMHRGKFAHEEKEEEQNEINKNSNVKYEDGSIDVSMQIIEGIEAQAGKGKIIEKDEKCKSERSVNFQKTNKHYEDKKGKLYERKNLIETEEKEDWFTPFPIKIKLPEYTKIKYISCGDMHTLAISTEGFLYGWGFNNFGCVGNGTNENVYEPTRIYLEQHKEEKNKSNINCESWYSTKYKFYGNNRENGNIYYNTAVIHCSAGSKHSLACSLSGDMYSWGYGGNGRLGIGNINSYNKPQLINIFKNRKRIVYVCSGKSHSGCIDTDYNVYTWGNGKFYKLGHANNDDDILLPKKLEFFNHKKKIFMLSFGCFNSFALNIHGDVFIWGTFNISNSHTSYYTCKIPKQINTNFKCVYLHASTYIAFGVTIVGDLIIFGGMQENANSRVLEKELNSDSDEDLMHYLVNEDCQGEFGANVASGMDLGIASARGNCGIGVSGSGKNTGWGKGARKGVKTLSLLAKEERFPIMYVKELRGKVHIRDILNDFYKLDRLTYYQNRVINALYGGDTAATATIGASANFYSYGGEYWPDKCNNQVLFEKNELVIRSRVKIIDGSDYFSVFLIESGKVYVSGVNKDGELGNGEYNLKKKFSVPVHVEICVNKIIKIACGNNYALALNDIGHVYGWGKNDKSQLGTGVIKDCYEPIHIKSLNNVINIYAGYDHSACIVNNSFIPNNGTELQHGELYVWGNAESGKTGLGLDYTEGSILLPRKINLMHKVYKCSLGTSHSLFLTDNNELYVCGSASNGKLGLSEKIHYMLSYPKKISLNEYIYIKDILAGGTFSMLLSMDGFIYIWGELLKNIIYYDAPTLYNQINNVKMIVGKYQHVFFLTYDNKLFGLGNNNYFQILYDSKKESYIDKPKLIPYFLKENIDNIFSVKNATYTQLSNNDIYAWGYAQNCHLGIGYTQLVYIKDPKKIIKSWLTYEEQEMQGNNMYNDDIDNNDEKENSERHLYRNYNEYANEINLLKKRIERKEKFFSDNILYTPYYEQEIEKMIYEIQQMSNMINWERIQILLKKEEYCSNSINYIKSYEKDLTDLYSKHIEFLLKLNSYEKLYNDLYLNYQNYVLSNIANMNEPLPTIIHTQNTHIFDHNRVKLQEFIYIIQQQPMYMILLCLIHNHKNIKNVKKLSYEKQKMEAAHYLFGYSNKSIIANKVNDPNGESNETNIGINYGANNETNIDINYGANNETNIGINYGANNETSIGINHGANNETSIDVNYGTNNETSIGVKYGTYNETYNGVNNGVITSRTKGEDTMMNYLSRKSSLMNHSYDYDIHDERKKCYIQQLKEKYSFYQNSTFIICSFIFDLYADLKCQRIRNIFTIFLIKLGIEEIKNCLHIDSLYKVETSIFFLLIKMLFMKNDFLLNFSQCIANMNNTNSFVRLLNEMSRKEKTSSQFAGNTDVPTVTPPTEVPGARTSQPPIIVRESSSAGHKSEANCNGKDYIAADYSNADFNSAHYNTAVKDERTNVATSRSANEEDKGERKIVSFIDESNDVKAKEFSTFIKGKSHEDKTFVFNNFTPISYPYNSNITGLENYGNIHPDGHNPLDDMSEKRVLHGNKNDGKKDILVEIDFVHAFKELCKIFRNIKFPDMFRIIMKNLFKYFAMYEKNISKDNNTQNKIYFFNDEDYIYLPFFNLLLMAVVNPILKNVNKLVEKFFFPPLPSHVTSICNKICDILEVLYLNKYQSLTSYNLKENFLSVKFIFENTFNSFVYVINDLCNTNEDIYVNMYINLFHYHLNRKSYYVQLKIFQLCHIFNLFFRYQNYLLLSFNDPAIEIVNYFYTYKCEESRVKEVDHVEEAGRADRGHVNPRHEMVIKGGVNKERAQSEWNKSEGKISNEKKNFLSKIVRNGIKKLVNAGKSNQGQKFDGEGTPREGGRDGGAQGDNNKKRGLGNGKKLIFNEEEINFFIKCKLVYNIMVDIRFLLREKNMNVCEFTKIPMPQYISYRKKTCITNNEYLFSIIHRYNYKKDNIYLISECLKNCPLIEQCTDTNNLILKLKSLRMYYMSLQDQKEINLVHLINRVVDIFLSNEMIYVDFCEHFPPNLYINKFNDCNFRRSTYKDEYFNMMQNTYDKSSFFQVKWRNVATQICINILMKKKHMVYLKKLYEEQANIEQLILDYQFQMKKNIQILKRAIIFASKLLIEKPILLYASHFEKTIYFITLKKIKYFRRMNKLPYDLSTIHTFRVSTLIKNSVLTNINEMLYPVMDYLTVDLFFDLNNFIKLSLVLTKDRSRNVINEHILTSSDIYRMCISSPFILYSFFRYNKNYLCTVNGFKFVHLLQGLAADLY